MAQRDVVLIVEDEVLVRHALAEYLRDCGYAVIEAADTDEAEAVLAAPENPVDAVLCAADAGGGQNGFAFARAVRARVPGLPVFLAGSPRKAAAAAAELCDEGDDLARPYDPVVVLDRIRRRLAARDRANGPS